jgi:hypothetical protein
MQVRAINSTYAPIPSDAGWQADTPVIAVAERVEAVSIRPLESVENS